ncbi:MAG: transposase [Gemmataceae bacterium]
MPAANGVLPGEGRAVDQPGQDEASIERLRERMKTPEARAKYRRRKQTVERLNPDLKEHRSSRRFRGLGPGRDPGSRPQPLNP